MKQAPKDFKACTHRYGDCSKVEIARKSVGLHVPYVRIGSHQQEAPTARAGAMLNDANALKELVGERGFEPPAPTSRT